MSSGGYIPDAGESFHFELYLEGPRIIVIGAVRGCDSRLGNYSELELLNYYVGRMREVAFEIATDQISLEHILDLRSTDGRRVMTHERLEFLPRSRGQC